MKEKIGLVLEGGGMRGMYTAGVLDVFLENNIHFDGIVGVSAGALFGVNFLSSQNGRVIRYNKKYNHDKRYMGIIPFLKEGNIISTQYAYEKVPHELDPFDNERYISSGIPFYAVVTNVENGLPEYIKIEDVYKQMDALRASGSLPMVSKSVCVDGKNYLDGGISDSIPFQWMLEQGYQKLVVVLTQDIHYRKKPFSKAMAKVFFRKYPKIEERMLQRHKVYNAAVEKLKILEEEGKVFIIRPSEQITVSKMEKNPDKLQAVYELGRRDCCSQLIKLKAYVDDFF